MAAEPRPRTDGYEVRERAWQGLQGVQSAVRRLLPGPCRLIFSPLHGTESVDPRLQTKPGSPAPLGPPIVCSTFARCVRVGMLEWLLVVPQLPPSSLNLYLLSVVGVFGAQTRNTKGSGRVFFRQDRFYEIVQGRVECTVLF